MDHSTKSLVSERREGSWVQINLSRGNVMESTEPPIPTATKLKRIAWLSKQDPKKTFGNLMHLFNYESLLECFHELDAKKAVGIDGVGKADYKKDLDVNLRDLLKRMKDMAYRPGPVREVLIPKEGMPGATRPLGISNFEDKIIQRMMQKILESIYEPLFLDCSHGFRPGRSCHTAIKSLHAHLFRNPIQTVIDIDLKNFFGTIDHKMMEEILKEKIKDVRLIRYINRMFKSGVLAEGDLRISEEGVTQGSICSPVLSNIFAHHALDMWIEMIRPYCRGTVHLFRYADDAIMCFQYDEDAQKIRRILPKRLAKLNLQLNEEKTKMVPFDKAKARKGIQQGTFDFLGFTFYWGKSKNGHTIPKLKTRGKTLRAKLNRMTEWVKKIRNKERLGTIWKTFTSKLRGHIQYYGVSHNYEGISKFIHESTRIMHKWLNRRSQRKSFNWDKFNLFMEVHALPKAVIVHKLF